MIVVGIAIRFLQDSFKAINSSRYATISLFRDDGILLARDPLGWDNIGDSFANRTAFRDVLSSGMSSAGYWAASSSRRPPLFPNPPLRQPLIPPWACGH
jgi:hypothetical protein